MQTLNTREVKFLFEKAKKIEHHPLIIYYRLQSDNISSKFAVSVPKKKIKKAVSRNRLKRQIRAIIRQKVITNFLTEKNINLAFLVIYNTQDLLEYSTIQQQFEEAFFKILQSIK